MELRQVLRLVAFIASTPSVLAFYRSVTPPFRQPSSALAMALTPIGPFSPFRSKKAEEKEREMEGITESGPSMMLDMERLRLDMEMGITPDVDRVVKIATSIEDKVKAWKTYVSNMKESADFQNLEQLQLTELHVQMSGFSVDELNEMMVWQSSVLRSLAENSVPPPVSPAVQKVMMSGMDAAPQVSVSDVLAGLDCTVRPPFTTEAVMGSEIAHKEWVRLLEDHEKLVDLGAGYGRFDPLGKIAYLDEIEKINDRWEIFYTRFSLMGSMNPGYVEDCDRLLKGLRLDEAQFRDLMKKVHKKMREEAERERDFLG